MAGREGREEMEGAGIWNGMRGDEEGCGKEDSTVWLSKEAGIFNI